MGVSALSASPIQKTWKFGSTAYGTAASTLVAA